MSLEAGLGPAPPAPSPRPFASWRRSLDCSTASAGGPLLSDSMGAQEVLQRGLSGCASLETLSEEQLPCLVAHISSAGSAAPSAEAGCSTAVCGCSGGNRSAAGALGVAIRCAGFSCLSENQGRSKLTGLFLGHSGPRILPGSPPRAVRTGPVAAPSGGVVCTRIAPPSSF